MLWYVLAGAVDVTEVGGTWVTIVTVLVLFTAGIIYQQLALSCSGAFPYVACSRSVRVNPALNFEKFWSTTLCTALGCILVYALCIDAGVSGTWSIVVTICCNVTAAFDGWIVTNVVRCTLIFGTRITVIAVCNDQAAILLLRVLAVPCI